MLEEVSHALGWTIALTASVLSLRLWMRLRWADRHAHSLELQVSWYKRALHHAGIGAWEWNMRTDEWRWSDRMYEIMGFPSAEPPPKGETFYGRIQGSDRHNTHAKEEECVNGKASLRNEYRFDTPDRGVRWVRDAGDVVLDAEGKPTHMLGVTIDVTDEKASLGLLERRAWTDDLTGISNRAALLRHIHDVVARSSADQLVIVAFIDLNGFKAVNDGLGHEAGDALLRHVASELRSALPPETFLARFGGDEFVCVSLTSPLHAEADMETMTARLRGVFSTVPVEDADVRIGAAVGMAVSYDGGSAEELMRAADAVMYEAKATRERFAVRFSVTLPTGGHGSAIPASRDSIKAA